MLSRIRIFAVAVVVLLCLVNRTDASTSYQLRSPNGKITVFIRVGDRIEYDLLLNQKPLLKDATLSIHIERRKLGVKPEVLSATPATVNRVHRPPVPQKFATLREHFNELFLQ